jgi:hypothetical protein
VEGEIAGWAVADLVVGDKDDPLSAVAIEGETEVGRPSNVGYVVLCCLSVRVRPLASTY